MLGSTHHSRLNRTSRSLQHLYLKTHTIPFRSSAWRHLHIPSAPHPFTLRGGSKGDARPSRPPSWSKFFQFHAVFGKIGKIVCWRPPRSWRPLPGEILDPPLTLYQVRQREWKIFLFFSLRRFHVDLPFRFPWTSLVWILISRLCA